MTLNILVNSMATVGTAFFTVTLVWAGMRFGNSKYGKNWSKFAFWQASLTVALILLNLQLAISGPEGIYEVTRPYVYLYMTVVSLLSTWYSIKMIRMEEQWKH